MTPEQFSYGTVALGESAQSSSAVNLTNSGNVNEDFSIRGNPASDGATTWTLLASGEGDPGSNTYVHEYGVGSSGSWIRMNPLSATKFTTGVAPAGTRDLWFKISLPTASDTLGTFTTTIYLVAEQH